MAGARNNEGERSQELQEGVSSRGREVYFIQKKMLSIQEIPPILNAQRFVNYSGRQMLSYIRRVDSHHFPHMQVPLPVTNLRHDTEKSALNNIYLDEGFKAKDASDCVRPEFKHMSFWSVDISSDDLVCARQQAYDQTNLEPDNKFRNEIMEQFGNSPVCNQSASRFGNFRFSFPLMYLLDKYKEQHCGGEEPQLRILGTDIFKQEIAHYIVVHSSDTSESFNDLPMVPTVQTNPGPNVFVYWMDGTLYWKPESTTEGLKVKISQDGSVKKECYAPCDYYTNYGDCFHLSYGAHSVWNHLIFAFHLPDALLKIPKGQLLENLNACDAVARPFLGRNRITENEAEEIIQRLKDQHEGGTN